MPFIHLKIEDDHLMHSNQVDVPVAAQECFACSKRETDKGISFQNICKSSLYVASCMIRTTTFSRRGIMINKTFPV